MLPEVMLQLDHVKPGLYRAKTQQKNQGGDPQSPICDALPRRVWPAPRRLYHLGEDLVLPGLGLVGLR